LCYAARIERKNFFHPALENGRARLTTAWTDAGDLRDDREAAPCLARARFRDEREPLGLLSDRVMSLTTSPMRAPARESAAVR